MSYKQASLYYKDGKSDKVYHAQIEKDRDGYAVNFQYGRRGSTLQTGSKTPIPVDLNKAEEIYCKLLSEKRAKGYTPGEEGTPFAQTENAGKVSGLVPQLLNPIDEAEVRFYLDSPSWIMQQKMDGNRMMIRIKDGVVSASNRKGLIIPLVSSIGQTLLDITEPHSAVLDGEAIGDVFWAFDILELDGNDLREAPVTTRYDHLARLLAPRRNHVALVLSFAGANKQTEYNDLKKNKAEGVVFKHVDSTYKPGRPNSGGNQVKFKFTESATCQVIVINGSKRSVMVAVRNPIETPVISVGNVTIPPNHEVPQIGALVEVQYLYAYYGGSLYQPIYKGVRTDKVKPDLYNSLKFKQGTDEEEA